MYACIGPTQILSKQMLQTPSRRSNLLGTSGNSICCTCLTTSLGTGLGWSICGDSKASTSGKRESAPHYPLDGPVPSLSTCLVDASTTCAAHPLSVLRRIPSIFPTFEFFESGLSRPPHRKSKDFVGGAAATFTGLPLVLQLAFRLVLALVL